ncbi:hypothetical protein BARBAKC583_1331 [Bartonella bacilliformis KC583]|uniref:Uncharacterized protein n=1 Tax=Bartonella bacilliformis (strain ATCC 35685 / KC583 / Herrer 020/F12,63) TaxID=360095 RepID=A1UUC6_BARBK|nr:hypothetical protein BARBAKC583_1331 [Bartonella bacilliformis KC583]
MMTNINHFKKIKPHSSFFIGGWWPFGLTITVFSLTILNI